jgi:hypothetical protein
LSAEVIEINFAALFFALFEYFLEFDADLSLFEKNMSYSSASQTDTNARSINQAQQSSFSFILPGIQ